MTCPQLNKLPHRVGQNKACVEMTNSLAEARSPVLHRDPIAATSWRAQGMRGVPAEEGVTLRTVRVGPTVP